MVQDENNAMDERFPQGPRFLLCDPTGNVAELSSPAEEWVSSPIQCLDRAVDKKPGIIVIRFGKMTIRERDSLVELSIALKRNRYTRTCPVLGLLHSKHRKLIEDLNRAKVEYVRYVGGVVLDSARIREIIDGLGTDDLVESHLKISCHFIHYSKIDSCREIALCGAYLDRMVLGGRRLNEICETENHFHCEYYLNPRLKP